MRGAKGRFPFINPNFEREISFSDFEEKREDSLLPLFSIHLLRDQKSSIFTIQRNRRRSDQIIRSD